MSNQDIFKIEVSAEMLANLLGLLNELPTKTNVWPLIQNFSEQARRQQEQPPDQKVLREPPAA